MGKFLSEKTAVITGGSSGIGRAIALRFAENGARVAIFDRNVEAGNLVVEELNAISQSRKAAFYQVDVSDFSSMQAAVKSLLIDFERVDVLVNNAGITRDNLLIRMKESDWDSVLNVNLKSVYNTCHALTRSMMKVKKGKIINIASVVGLTGNPGQVNYAASKAGMIGLSKSLAKELASRHICVNCIAPGYIQTKMTEALTESQKESVLLQIPMGRMGTPKDIANTALFLASELSDYITGKVITVDGGMFM